jgi:tetratricopeptide (TPR) repeat protein
MDTYGEDHPDVAIDRNNLGLAWDSLGQYDKAIEYFELALATFKKVLGVDHPSTKTVAGNLALARAER